jgi:hypothetical protein
MSNIKFNTDDPRMGDWIQHTNTIPSLQSEINSHIVILGFPYDEGCKRNGGRVGMNKNLQTNLQSRIQYQHRSN